MWCSTRQNAAKIRENVPSLVVAALIGLALCTSPRLSAAMPITAWEKRDTKGEWTVYKNPEHVAGKSGCVAIYHHAFDIQLTADGLTLAYGMKGGIDSVRWRLDQGEWHSAVALGKQRTMGAYIFTDEGESADASVLTNIINGKQLHVEITKLVGEPETVDLMLAGIHATMATLWGNECQ